MMMMKMNDTNFFLSIFFEFMINNQSQIIITINNHLSWLVTSTQCSLSLVERVKKRLMVSKNRRGFDETEVE